MQILVVATMLLAHEKMNIISKSLLETLDGSLHERETQFEPYVCIAVMSMM